MPWPWHTWVWLAVVGVLPVELALQLARDVPVETPQLVVLSVMLSGLLVWLLVLVLGRFVPHRVYGHYRTIGLKRVLDGQYLLHVHSRACHSASWVRVLRGVPVSFLGRLGRQVEFNVESVVLVSGVINLEQWRVRLRPTGRATDAHLFPFDSLPIVCTKAADEKSRHELTFAHWGDLLWTTLHYESVEALLASEERVAQLQAGHAETLAKREALIGEYRLVAHNLRRTVAEHVEWLTRVLGTPIRIPVDQDPMGQLEKVANQVEVALERANACAREQANKCAELETVERQRVQVVDEAVARLAEALEIELEGEYPPLGKLTHASLYAGELFPELRRKLTVVSRRAFEAEALTKVLGPALMELRFWMAEDVTIRSKLFAQVRRFFQEIITPQIIECDNGRERLREWYEEAKKSAGHSVLNDLPERQQYRGDFDDIIEAPKIAQGSLNGSALQKTIRRPSFRGRRR